MIVKLLLRLISVESRKLTSLTTCIILLMFPQIILSQISNLPIGTRSLGMGATYVALANSADAIFLNPGGLSQIERKELLVFYQKPFGLEDVNFGSAAFILPFSKISTGIGIISLNNGLLSEQTLKLAIGKQVEQKFYYGLALNYSSLQIKNYGSTSTFGLDIGLLMHLNNKMRLGFQAQNLNRSNIGKTKETMPQSIKSGVSISPTPELILNLEIFKEIEFAEEIRFGIEYKLIPSLSLRLGTASNPDRFSSGFGIAINPFLIDYAFFSHNDLGLTHQVSLSIKFGKLNSKNLTLPEEHSLPLIQKKQSQSKKIEVEKTDNNPININTAEVKDLVNLPGIGKKTASAIINFRKKNGEFKKKEDLGLVKGIGKNKLEKILPLITVK